MAIAASDAVPTPASTITGTFACSTIRRMLIRFWMPSPEPMGAASGMIAAAPMSSSRLRQQRIVGAIDHDLEAFAHEHFGRAQGFDHVGIERLLVAQDFELDEGPAARLAREAQRAQRVLGGVTARGVGQVDVFLRDR